MGWGRTRSAGGALANALAPFWLPFGGFGGSLWLPFGFPWVPLGSFLLTMEVLFGANRPIFSLSIYLSVYIYIYIDI